MLVPWKCLLTVYENIFIVCSFLAHSFALSLSGFGRFALELIVWWFFSYFSARSHPYGMENIFSSSFSLFLKIYTFSCTSIPPGRKRVSRRCEWRAARKFLCATLKHTIEGRDVVCSIQKSSMECFVHFPSHQALTL